MKDHVELINEIAATVQRADDLRRRVDDHARRVDDCLRRTRWLTGRGSRPLLLAALDSPFNLSADPRISTERPAWLADDQEWRGQLQAMDLDADIKWIERHWTMAAGPKAMVDTSWITYEPVGIIPWRILVLFVALALLPVLLGVASVLWP